jgi:hypothetical protein
MNEMPSTCISHALIEPILVGGGKRMFPDGGQAPDRDARRLGIYLLIGRRTAVATGDWRRSL